MFRSAGVAIFDFLASDLLDNECLTVLRDRSKNFYFGESQCDGYEIFIIKLFALIVVRLRLSFFFFISSGMIWISLLGSLKTLGVSVLTARTAPLCLEVILFLFEIEF